MNACSSGKTVSGFLFAAFFISVLMLPHLAGADEKRPVYIADLHGAVNPGSADYITRCIKRANEQEAGCLVIRIDTPGGLADSMRSIVKEILASRVCIVAYVSPSGARSASAGVIITMAADIAAMAPGTNIGAAHPVGAGGKDIGEKMSEKVTNDMAAYAKSIAEKRGRNAEWAEDAVRKSVSITETEAVEKNIVDLIARDLDDLIEKIDGRSLASKGKLNLDKSQRIYLEESVRDKVLKIISDPNIAYILFMIGLAGLYFELAHPGAVLPGVLGGLSLILAFFAFQTLPINMAGVLLILFAILLFIMEMKITSYGLLSLTGAVSLVLGSMMLVKKGYGAAISFDILLPISIFVALFFVVIAAVVFRSQYRRPKTGSQAMVGLTGKVQEEIDPEGKIMVNGELWRAVSEYRIEPGKRVKVIGAEGLLLKVEPVPGSSLMQDKKRGEA